MKPIDFEIVSVHDAKRALADTAKPDASEWIFKRVQSPEEPLLHVTRAWLASLPQDVCPTELVGQFPRIVNRLRYLWKQVARCEAYMDDLLVDRRGTRSGFPLKVTQELEALREYYAVLHPTKRSAWSHV